MYFEVIKPRTQYDYKAIYGIGDENEIFHHYTKPSQTKQEIWCDWVQWARDTKGVVGLRISGANCMSFSIKGWYIENENEYYIWITKSHNRLYLMK